MTFDYAALAAAGMETVRIEYAGSGDEGWINEIAFSPEDAHASDDLRERTEQQAYDVLGDHYGGWEINEGSSGTIMIDVKARQVKIEHNWVVESTRPDNKVIT